MSVRRWIHLALLQVAAASLTVAVSVASNQILNDGVWNFWWTLIAVPATGIAAGLTLLMTRTHTASSAEDADEPEDQEEPSEAPEPKKTERTRHPSSQVVRNVTTGGPIIQIRDVGGDVEIGGS